MHVRKYLPTLLNFEFVLEENLILFRSHDGPLDMIQIKSEE